MPQTSTSERRMRSWNLVAPMIAAFAATAALTAAVQASAPAAASAMEATESEVGCMEWSEEEAGWIVCLDDSGPGEVEDDYEGFPIEETAYEKEHQREIEELDQEITADSAEENEADRAKGTRLAEEELRQLDRDEFDNREVEMLEAEERELGAVWAQCDILFAEETAAFEVLATIQSSDRYTGQNAENGRRAFARAMALSREFDACEERWHVEVEHVVLRRKILGLPEDRNQIPYRAWVVDDPPNRPATPDPKSERRAKRAAKRAARKFKARHLSDRR